MLCTSKEESLTNSCIQKNIFFLIREFEGILEHIYRRWGLFEEKLDRSIRYNRFSIIRTHKILNILCNSRDTKSILTSSFDKTKEKFCTRLILHDIPSFINDQKAFFFFFPREIPHISKHDIHSSRTQKFIKITYREYLKTTSEFHIRWRRKYTTKYSIYIFIKSLCESFSAIHRLKHGIKILHQWYLFSFDTIIRESDSFE